MQKAIGLCVNMLIVSCLHGANHTMLSLSKRTGLLIAGRTGKNTDNDK